MTNGPQSDAGAFADAIRTVVAHNHDYSFETILVRALGLKADGDQLVEAHEDGPVSLADERDMSLSLVDLLSAGPLVDAGIDLVTASDGLKITRSTQGGEAIITSQVRLHLRDGGAFVNQLATMPPGVADDIAEAVTTAAGDTLTFASANGMEGLAEVIEFAGPITYQLQRLGVGNSPTAEQWRCLHEFSMRDDVDGYAAAHAIGMFAAHDDYDSPAKYTSFAKDETEVAARWDGALALVDSVRAAFPGDWLGGCLTRLAAAHATASRDHTNHVIEMRAGQESCADLMPRWKAAVTVLDGIIARIDAMSRGPVASGGLEI